MLRLDHGIGVALTAFDINAGSGGQEISNLDVRVDYWGRLSIPIVALSGWRAYSRITAICGSDQTHIRMLEMFATRDCLRETSTVYIALSGWRAYSHVA